MRSIHVQFPSGREVLRSYWGFLRGGGLILPEPQDLAEGTPLRVEVHIKSLKQSYHFNGQVVRATEQQVCITFDEGQDQDVMLNAAWADTHDVPQRKHRRYATGAAPQVRYAMADRVLDQDRMLRGELLDVSSGGCRLKGPASLPSGSRVQVVISDHTGGEVTKVGKVRWTTPGKNEMGIEFAHPDADVSGLFERCA